MDDDVGYAWKSPGRRSRENYGKNTPIEETVRPKLSHGEKLERLEVAETKANEDAKKLGFTLLIDDWDMLCNYRDYISNHTREILNEMDV